METGLFTAESPSEVREYSNDAGTFSISIRVHSPGILHLTKRGYQRIEDVQAEADLITYFVETYFKGVVPCLCVDSSQLKGLSRQTRQLHNESMKGMPFRAVAAYGLSLAVRFIASSFVRRMSKDTIRLFASEDEAIEYLRSCLDSHRNEDRSQHQTSEENPSHPRRIADDDSVSVHERSFGAQLCRAVSKTDWTYETSDASFRTQHTLLNDDIVLTESQGHLTATVVDETNALTNLVLEDLGMESLYYIHDARFVSKVSRQARLQLRNVYEHQSKSTRLSVIVGKTIHVIMIRWLRALAPSVFSKWFVVSSVECALELVEEHRTQNNPVHDTGNASNGPGEAEDSQASGRNLARFSREELIALVQKQQTMLDHHNQALDVFLDRLGGLSWASPTELREVSQPQSEQFDLLFGALDLMASDIRDAMGELNDKMTELSQSKKQLSMAQKIAHLGSWDWHVQTGKLTWSDETFRLYGYAPGSVDVSYELFVSHLHPEIRQSIVEAIQRTLTENAPFENIQRVIDAHGHERILSARGWVERGADNEPIRMYGTTRDVTEIERARSAEQQAHREMRKREADLRETLLDLSHDVRTPLSSLKIGLGRLGGDDANKGLRSALVAEVEYLDSLFANLVSLLRLKGSSIQLQMAPLRANDVLSRVHSRLNILASEKQISFDFADAHETILVNGDPIALEQALGNLVHNAIKYASQNVAVVLDKRDGFAVFEVSDDGPGLADIDIPKITDRYYRGETVKSSPGRGLGLGLPIALAIIEEHRGRLQLNRIGVSGTRATVLIPSQTE